LVSWITRTLGVKSSRSKLRKEEFGLIIVDLRDVVDGPNDPMDIIKTFNKVLTVAAVGRKSNVKVVLQCEAGISRSCAFVAAIFVHANDMEWDDAIDFVKKKVPECQMNLELIDSIKEALERV